MISFLLASVLSAQANPVTVEIEIAPAAVVLEKLGKEMGVEMIPGGSVSKDVFGIAFTKAPSAKVLSEIATTLNAQWERSSGGTYILTRTPKQEGDEDRAMQEQLRKTIEEDLAKTKNQGEFDEKVAIQLITEAQRLVSLGSQDGLNSRLTQIERQTPRHRLLQTILETIGPAELVQPWTESPIEYTINPSPRQKRLPPSLQAAFRKFEAESRLHANAIEAVGVVDGRHAGRYRDIFQPSFGRASGKINYTLQTQMTQGTSFSVRFRIDAEGGESEVRFRTFSLSAGSGEAKYAHFAAGMSEPIPLTAEEKALIDKKTVPNPGMRHVIENFATKDLLAYFSEAPYRLLAKAKKVDRVSLLSDIEWGFYHLGSREKDLSLESYFSRPGLPHNYHIEIENGTLRVRPVNRRVVREGRLPRSQMTQVLAGLDRLKYADIDVLASLAASTDHDQAVRSASQFLVTASGINWAEALYPRNAIEMLRLYGRFGPQDKAKTRGEGLILNLPVTDASSEAAIQKMIYLDSKLVAEYPEQDGIPLGYSMMSPEDAKLEQNLAVVFANGYPPGSKIRIRLNILPRLFRIQNGPDRPNAISMTSPTGVGFTLAQNQLGRNPVEAKYAMAPNAELVIDLDFQARGKMRFVILHRQSPTEPKFGPIESLPPDIREQIEAAYKKLLERMKPPPPASH